ncbi:phage holin family protein [uncultured Planococcus sp.]|uniref:phage holin family protein n=1 Tax=uncultured Planococcus sp. TaxID=337815 RepID=UPI002603311F|nr:phage holin family protein [uncultured Planococcus sp.]
MKINWKVRRRNPLFWLQVFLSVAVPVGAYFGLTGADMTSWPALGKVVVDAVSNPYVLFTAGISLYNAVSDPTTGGFSDSPQALRYHQPKKGGN